MEANERSATYWSEYDFTKIPFDQLIRVGQRSLLYRDLFCVSWLLGRYCNYKCSYCWPYARSDVRDHRPTELLVQTMDEIKRQARARGFNSFHFSFSGGEPTTHKGYLELLSHYGKDMPHSNYQSVHMTSNLSPGIGWFKKYIEATASLNRVSVTASYHSEFSNREAFRDKILFLQDGDVQVTINMVMVPERFEQLWELALFFHEANINVTLKPQSNPTATKVVDGYTAEQLLRLKNGMPQRGYTEQQLKKADKKSQRPKSKLDFTPYAPEGIIPRPRVDAPSIMQVELTDSGGQPWFMDQAERFNAFEFNQFQGWECSAGYRSIIIREPDGTVKRSYSCSDQPLGHIESGFHLFNKPMPCQTASCVSSADSKIPKRKAGVSLPLWPGDKTFGEP
ncbi:MAG: radical SAM protein [Bdellovibrionales bacterium]|nr:radical SAM protein [Bdellovibrionales bacterium]